MRDFRGLAGVIPFGDRPALMQEFADTRTGVAEAKVTAKYDVDMAKADGDHKVATEKCVALPPDAQQGCKDKADADYETAKVAAKATRLAKQQ